MRWSQTGKPVVVVLINGRPLAIPRVAEHSAGNPRDLVFGAGRRHAIGDVLFGTVNPGGKLPVTSHDTSVSFRCITIAGRHRIDLRRSDARAAVAVRPRTELHDVHSWCASVSPRQSDPAVARRLPAVRTPSTFQFYVLLARALADELHQYIDKSSCSASTTTWGRWASREILYLRFANTMLGRDLEPELHRVGPRSRWRRTSASRTAGTSTTPSALCATWSSITSCRSSA